MLNGIRQASKWLCLPALLLAPLLGSGCSDDVSDTPIETQTRLYVGHQSESTVRVVDLDTFLPLESLSVSSPVSAILLHPQRTNFYMVQPAQNRVLKVLEKTGAPQATIPTTGRVPTGIAFEPFGTLDNGVTFFATLAFVSERNSNSVSVIRLAENEILDTISVGSQPSAIQVEDRRPQIYVLNEGSRDLSIINVIDFSILETLPLNANPRGLAFNPSKDTVYITDFTGGRLLEIDTNVPRVEDAEIFFDDIATCAQPFGVATNTAGTKIFVSCPNENALQIIDVADPTQTSLIPTGAGPTIIKVRAADDLVFVANTGEASVTAIDSVNGQVVATIPVGQNPVTLELF